MTYFTKTFPNLLFVFKQVLNICITGAIKKITYRNRTHTHYICTYLYTNT